ncbi:head closure [Acinetobacter phage Acj9]|uniref:Head completion nuclease n=1 Tax=Acinetobacter phage Acj9 TaxID=760939 RepID=E5EPU2_9CAUD|nr:head closure [Acinetobacter phage Acj9]ADG60058.1 gp4 head completion protein [Acinetobacter phage Acj9]
MAHSGRFVPKNKMKYRGHVDKITYRSSWELFYMKWCDSNDKVTAWSSEEAVIPYFSHADGRKRRYFMDIWFKIEGGQEFFIEIKPKKETVRPVPPQNLTAASKKRFAQEIYTFMVNQDKWKAAKALADKRGIIFRVLTEDGLRKMGAKI